MNSAVFAGTFDPVTNGHVDLIRRALRVVDRLTVAVASRPEKQVLFSQEARVEMIREALGAEPRLEVAPFSGLLVEYARERKIGIIIRGVRFVSDFEYEFQMALMNRRLSDQVDTIFLMPSEAHTFVNSTLSQRPSRHVARTSTTPPGASSRRIVSGSRISTIPVSSRTVAVQIVFDPDIAGYSVGSMMMNPASQSDRVAGTTRFAWAATLPRGSRSSRRRSQSWSR